MPPCSRTLSSAFCSSNVKPYWNPEHPPPWMKTRSGLPSESGIDLAKYFTFSIAASVSVRSGPSVIGVGVLDSTGVEDIRVSLNYRGKRHYLRLGHRRFSPAPARLEPPRPVKGEGLTI